MHMMPALLAAAFLRPAASAQDVPRRSEEELEQRRKTQEQLLKTAEEAGKTVVAEPFEAVTYEDVMKDPDNIGLNFSFARTQVAQGDILKAAATLERILMVDPELPRVRLFYASVLFRLDNLDDAERELKTLTQQKLTAPLREELEGYRKQIQRRRRKTRLGLSVMAGFDFDENRNSAPAFGKRLAADIPVVLDEGSTRKSDTAKTMNAALSVSHDLGYQAGHSLFSTLSYYRAEQTHVRTLNLQSYNGTLGGTFKSEAADVTPAMSFGHLLLAETTYQRSYGPSLRLDKRLGQRLGVFGTAGYQRQIYARTQIVPAADQRTGDQHYGGIGCSYAFNRGFSLAASYVHTLQGASEAFNAYERDALSITATKVLPQGRFLVLSLMPQLDEYLAADDSISRKVRQDHAYRSQLTFGTPVVKSLLLVLSYEYFHSRSNIPNYAYTNNKLSSSLTYRLDL
ncbi:MAG: tetratricopeptide repeat protein [Elusimicrobia bacterium]|nr:tetratricopeptide repeat protein [Elusimicrobiota bacterium]